MNCDNVSQTRLKGKGWQIHWAKNGSRCFFVYERERERENTNTNPCPTYLIYRNEDTKNGVHRIAASTLFAQVTFPHAQSGRKKKKTARPPPHKKDKNESVVDSHCGGDGRV